MTVLLWILQILLAGAFAMAGVMKATRRKEQLAASMGWVDDFSSGQVKAIGVAEILAAIGLIFPWWLNVAPVLTPLAATGLVLLMIGAAVTHARRREWPMIGINAVLGVLAAVVAVGRF
jgi:uncharacterized membrane protein YphA (DoxX/SURF4 family)